jgi:hypothetical protein
VPVLATPQVIALATVAAVAGGLERAVPFFLFQSETDVIKDAGRFASFTQPDRFVAELLAQGSPTGLSGQTRIHPGALTLPARRQWAPCPAQTTASAARLLRWLSRA